MSMTFSGLKLNEKHEITLGGIEAEFTTPDGKPLAGAQYSLKLSDGSERTGTLTNEGKLRESNLKPGTKASIRLVGFPFIAKAQ